MKAKVKDILGGYLYDKGLLRRAIEEELLNSGASPGEDAEVDVGRMCLRLARRGDHLDKDRDKAIRHMLEQVCPEFTEEVNAWAKRRAVNLSGLDHNVVNLHQVTAELKLVEEAINKVLENKLGAYRDVSRKSSGKLFSSEVVPKPARRKGVHARMHKLMGEALYDARESYLKVLHRRQENLRRLEKLLQGCPVDLDWYNSDAVEHLIGDFLEKHFLIKR